MGVLTRGRSIASVAFMGLILVVATEIEFVARCDYLRKRDPASQDWALGPDRCPWTYNPGMCGWKIHALSMAGWQVRDESDSPASAEEGCVGFRLRQNAVILRFLGGE